MPSPTPSRIGFVLRQTTGERPSEAALASAAAWFAKHDLDDELIGKGGYEAPCQGDPLFHPRMAGRTDQSAIDAHNAAADYCRAMVESCANAKALSAPYRAIREAFEKAAA